jgi:hypothetical protein
VTPAAQGEVQWKLFHRRDEGGVCGNDAWSVEGGETIRIRLSSSPHQDSVHSLFSGLVHASTDT